MPPGQIAMRDRGQHVRIFRKAMRRGLERGRSTAVDNVNSGGGDGNGGPEGAAIETAPSPALAQTVRADASLRSDSVDTRHANVTIGSGSSEDSLLLLYWARKGVSECEADKCVRIDQDNGKQPNDTAAVTAAEAARG